MGKDYDEMIGTVPHCFVCHDDIFPTGSDNAYALYFKCENEDCANIIASWCELHDIDMKISEEQMVGNVVVAECIYGGDSFDSIDWDWTYCELTLLELWIKSTSHLMRFVNNWERE